MFMASSKDTEIPLGTAKLLGLFFGLVGICAVFFSLGYTLGRKTDPGVAAGTTLAPLRAAHGVKPGGSSATASTPMTFYKAVEQQNANPQLTSAAAVAAPPDASRQQTAASSASSAGSSSSGASAPTSNPPSPMAPPPA